MKNDRWVHWGTLIRYSVVILSITATSLTYGQDDDRRKRSNNNRTSNQPDKPRRSLPEPPAFPDIFRTIDGSGNNIAHSDWGSVDSELLRLASVGYEDGTDSPAGSDRPGAREISNSVSVQTENIPNARGVSDFFWQWGQFLDHDITLVPIAGPSEPFNIPVPAGDPYFDPTATGTEVIPFERSFYFANDGSVREQVNEITAFIDASNVYGSDETRAEDLRTLDGTGRLRTSDGDLLPFNTSELPNAPSNDPAYFLAGDFRANEQIALTTMHTLFLREHNYWADYFYQQNPSLDGDSIYEMARSIVTAEMQAITYREFLPLLLGQRTLPRYNGYDPGVLPGISNEFATAAYRFGHSMLSSQVLRLNANGTPITEENLSLAEAFFVGPDALQSHGIEPVLRGLSAQYAQELDTQVIDEVRNLLFGAPGSGGLDLAALNIQRGRDHGLPSYNEVRIAYGLTPVGSFAEINPDTEVINRLSAVYTDVDDLDLWVAGLAETKYRDAMVGETFYTIIKDQFLRLRDGDRFWYQNYLPLDWIQYVESQTLAQVIRRNTTISNEIPDNVFIVQSPERTKTRRRR